MSESYCHMWISKFNDQNELGDILEINNTGEHDFGTWKVYCVSNVTFHAEFKYAIKTFPSPTVFVQ